MKIEQLTICTTGGGTSQLSLGTMHNACGGVLDLTNCLRSLALTECSSALAPMKILRRSQVI